MLLFGAYTISVQTGLSYLALHLTHKICNLSSDTLHVSWTKTLLRHEHCMGHKAASHAIAQ